MSCTATKVRSYMPAPISGVTNVKLNLVGGVLSGRNLTLVPVTVVMVETSVAVTVSPGRDDELTSLCPACKHTAWPFNHT